MRSQSRDLARIGACHGGALSAARGSHQARFSDGVDPVNEDIRRPLSREVEERERKKTAENGAHEESQESLPG